MLRGVVYLFEYGVALLRIFLLISLVCFLPRLFFMRETKSFVSLAHSVSSYESDIKALTLAIIKQWCSAKAHIKIALIVTETDYKNIYDIPIDTIVHMDDLIALPSSAYKDQARSLSVAHDIILIDIANVGLSYISSCHFLFDILDNAATNNIPVVIHDRPNILGKKIEGPVCSFMKGSRCFKLPFRHGMTVAELARYYNADVLENKVALHILPLNNYNRADSSWVHSMYDEYFCTRVNAFTICGIMHQIVPSLSNNVCHQNCIMLPHETIFLDQQWYQLQSLLKEFGFTSFLYRYSDKDSDGFYRGLKIDNMQLDDADCFKVILAIIDFFKAADIPLVFPEQFDRIVGTSLVRRYAKGMISKKKLFACINKDLELFYRSAFAHFMYYPLPQLSLM